MASQRNQIGGAKVERLGIRVVFRAMDDLRFRPILAELLLEDVGRVVQRSPMLQDQPELGCGSKG